jgi:hypothetical protein
MIPPARIVLCGLVFGAPLLSCSEDGSVPPQSTAGTSGAGIAGTGGSATGGAGGAGMGGTRGGINAEASGGSGGTTPDPTDASTSCSQFVMPSDCTIPPGAVLPGELRCTGLYGDWEARQLACGVVPYEPAHELWSDGAEKHRFVSLPPDATIDTSDPDGFVYPVGTQFWKEFRVGAPGRQRIGETRIMRKTAEGWLYTTYVWSEDGGTAFQENEGVENLLGTLHTVPTRQQCRDCHAGRPDFVLGWDPILLGAGATGVTRETLATSNVLSAPVSGQIPGTEVERAALAYLHTNCGVSCHNDTAEAIGRLSGLWLRLDADRLGSVRQTDAVTTGINRTPSPNVELVGLTPPAGGFYDFRPLDSGRSLAVAKMNVRGAGATSMPPIGTNQVDSAGLTAVVAWVNQMTVERGYPAAAP